MKGCSAGARPSGVIRRRYGSIMRTKVFITIDTEEDLWDKWKATDNPVRNISRIPMLQEVFDRFGAVPTYLVDYPVVADNGSRAILKKIHDAGGCEIGTHCHPWNTPPIVHGAINNHNSMLSNLPYDVLCPKIETLHREIVNRFGVAPVSFRAGRWGFSSDVARCIAGLGYRIDTSIIPFTDLGKMEGPDFSGARLAPYRFKPEDIFRQNPDGPLLEVPPTVGFLQADFEKCSNVSAIIRRSLGYGVPSRVVFKALDVLRILNYRCLSPELSNGEDMLDLARTVVAAGCGYLHIFMHSTVLIPGVTSHVRNEEELRGLLERTEMVLGYAADRGYEFSPLSGALAF